MSQLRNDLRYTAQRCREECDELRRQMKGLQAAVDGKAQAQVRGQVKRRVRHQSDSKIAYKMVGLLEVLQAQPWHQECLLPRLSCSLENQSLSNSIYLRIFGTKKGRAVCVR